MDFEASKFILIPVRNTEAPAPPQQPQDIFKDTPLRYLVDHRVWNQSGGWQEKTFARCDYSASWIAMQPNLGIRKRARRILPPAHSPVPRPGQVSEQFTLKSMIRVWPITTSVVLMPWKTCIIAAMPLLGDMCCRTRLTRHTRQMRFACRNALVNDNQIKFTSTNNARRWCQTTVVGKRGQRQWVSMPLTLCCGASEPLRMC